LLRAHPRENPLSPKNTLPECPSLSLPLRRDFTLCGMHGEKARLTLRTKGSLTPLCCIAITGEASPRFCGTLFERISKLVDSPSSDKPRGHPRDRRAHGRGPGREAAAKISRFSAFLCRIFEEKSDPETMVRRQHRPRPPRPRRGGPHGRRRASSRSALGLPLFSIIVQYSTIQYGTVQCSREYEC